MRVLPVKGMPARGSFADSVACEMLLRERRQLIITNLYHAQLTVAAYQLPVALFNTITQRFLDEVSHELYRPAVLKEKRALLDALRKRKTRFTENIAKVASYEIKNSEDLKPYSPEELERVHTLMRRAALKRHTKPTAS